VRYLSLCSGIEAASVAWHPLGWAPVAFAEIEPFPSAVLAHHYPDVPNFGEKTGPLDTDGHTMAVAFDAYNQSASDISHPLRCGTGSGKGDEIPQALTGMQVRRLTPRECERLQGFPDDYTLIPYRGALAKDGPRYKALGNSMAVPVMRWIGDRIATVHAATAREEVAA
jgi:site-specific DNA-cytosine methylase